MNKYYYTIDEMMTLIAEWHETRKIIEEFKKQENVDVITEEEFILLFGESTLNPNIYYPPLYQGKRFHYISDYEQFLLDHGYDPFTAEVIDHSWFCYEMNDTDYLNSEDFAQDLCMANKNLTFEQAIEQLSLLERECLLIDEDNNFAGTGFISFGYIGDYFEKSESDFEMLNFEEPDCIVEGELEFMLAQDLEYYSSLKSKDVTVYVSDISLVTELLKKPLDETVFRLFIHWNDGENQFLITITDNELYYYYKVELQSGNSCTEKIAYLGSCLDSNYVLTIIHYFQDTGKSFGYCDGLTEFEFLKDNIIDNPIISEGSLDLIIDLATRRYYRGTINLEIEQALIIMLSITHFFKFEMDHKINWYNKHDNRVKKELEDFKKAEGIMDWWGEMDWIHKNGALQYNICIQDLLLQTLYTLNGSYYRINDRDYDWEEEFDKIFVDMPYGREFDREMIRFLLLPLYNSTHNTNYALQSDYLNNNVENSNK